MATTTSPSPPHEEGKIKQTMQQGYSNLILDHYRNPRNFGILKEATHSAEELNPLCGDEIKVYLKVQGSKIQDLKYEARGCALSIAAASMLSEEIADLRLQIADLKKMGTEDIGELLGVKIAPAREQCALLALNTIKKAILKGLSSPT